MTIRRPQVAAPRSPLAAALRGVAYVASSNGISMLASALVVLLVPKYTGVTAYSYLQLFLFYASYVGFLHAGWADGLYLRYGGRDFESLPNRLIGTQFRMLLAMQLVMSAGVLVWALVMSDSPERHYVLVSVAVACLALNLRVFPLLLLQATNRIPEYARVMVLDRLVYVGLVVALIVAGVGDFRYYVWASLLGTIGSLTLAVWYCRPALTSGRLPRAGDWAELRANLSAGAGLMLASIASMLPIGVVRFGIEAQWGVVAFGKISLTLSLLNLALTFANAVSVVFFPMVKRADARSWPRLFEAMRSLTVAALLGSLLLYSPIHWAMATWLPDYADALAYLPLLFPVVVFEAKQAVVTNTYFKALRLERAMLAVNTSVVALSAVLCVVTTVVLQDLALTVASIPALVAVRSVVSDMVLKSHLGIGQVRAVVSELAVVCVFVAVWRSTDQWWGVLVVAAAVATHVALNRAVLAQGMRVLRLGRLPAASGVATAHHTQATRHAVTVPDDGLYGSLPES